VYCAGQWSLWQSLGDFRKRLYTTPLIESLRRQLFADGIWSSLEGRSVPALARRPPGGAGGGRDGGAGSVAGRAGQGAGGGGVAVVHRGADPCASSPVPPGGRPGCGTALTSG